MVRLAAEILIILKLLMARFTFPQVGGPLSQNQRLRQQKVNGRGLKKIIEGFWIFIGLIPSYTKLNGKYTFRILSQPTRIDGSYHQGGQGHRFLN